MSSRLMFGGLAVMVCAGVLLLAGPVFGQAVFDPNAPWPVSGVYIDPEGVVRYRQVEKRPDLAVLRARVKAAQTTRPDNDPLTYVSLNRVLDEAREAVKAGRPIPDECRYLGNITQLEYVFVYPKEKDLVIAGLAEQIDQTNKVQPVGKTTGRPVLQLDDLVVALRTLHDGRAGVFGCSIDPTTDMVKIATDLAAKYEGEDLRKRVIKAIGPQKVSVFGTAADTRLAFIMVAADFKLKRMFLGLESNPVAPIGNALGNAGAINNRFWFEPDYNPLRVSADGNAYAISGQRLQVKCGRTMLDARGATERAKRFSKAFTDHMTAVAASDPLFADLQNIADMALLAALIRQDKLAPKTGLDVAWAIASYPVGKVPVPRTTETLANLTSYSLAMGGVMMQVSPFIADSARQSDPHDVLSGLRDRPSEGVVVTRSPK